MVSFFMGCPYTVVVHKYKKQLAEYNSDPNKVSRFGETPLMQRPLEHRLMIIPDVKIMEPLLIRDPNINTIPDTLAIENIGRKVISPSLITVFSSTKKTKDIAMTDK
jgi:hypothetical protein